MADRTIHSHVKCAVSAFLPIAGLRTFVTACVFFAPSIMAFPQAPAPPQSGPSASIDAIAVRIESDIITESEINELAEFQRLIQGRPVLRSALIDELIDQWIVRNEAQSSQFLRPQPEEIDKALADLSQHFASPDAFHQRIAEIGLTEKEVRRQLALQIYLDRFLDYKFRAAAQVDEKQIQEFYSGDFKRESQEHGEAVPPLEEVHADISQLLTERVITEKANKWLNDTRARLHIEIVKASGSQ